MNYLIDTHTFLWYVANNSSLSNMAKQIIADSDNQIFVSIASFWEISIKVSQDKLTIPMPLLGFINSQLKINRFSLLPIKLEAVDILSNLPFHHKDPFDRMIIAQSMADNVPIISIDAVFDTYPITRIW